VTVNIYFEKHFHRFNWIISLSQNMSTRIANNVLQSLLLMTFVNLNQTYKNIIPLIWWMFKVHIIFISDGSSESPTSASGPLRASQNKMHARGLILGSNRLIGILPVILYTVFSNVKWICTIKYENRTRVLYK